MRSVGNAWKPIRTNGQMDGRTGRETVIVGRMDQRTYVQMERGYFGLRTDGQMDDQPENSAPEGGGVKWHGHFALT